jgi:nitrile hydratase accessory protein
MALHRSVRRAGTSCVLRCMATLPRARVNAADPPPDAPVFEEPWQAHAFAMTLTLHARGVFTWSEWSNALSQAISGGGETYYLHWLRALEALVAAKGVASNHELTRLRQAWRNAAERTPHGAPIVLADEDLEDSPHGTESTEHIG